MIGIKLSVAAIAAAAMTVGFSADAASISLNFSENSANQVFAGGENIGPFASNSSNWNNTASVGSTPGGAMAGLIDDSGAATGVSVTWASKEAWFTTAGTATDEARLGVGYIDDSDDGGSSAADGDGLGVTVDFAGITYAAYTVTLLFGSDQNAGTAVYESLEFTVNGTGTYGGAGTATTYRNIDDANANAGSAWVDMVGGTVTGNYVTVASSGATIDINGPARNGVERGSLVGVIITEVPEPGSLALLGLGGLMLVRRRRG